MATCSPSNPTTPATGREPPVPWVTLCNYDCPEASTILSSSKPTLMMESRQGSVLSESLDQLSKELPLDQSYIHDDNLPF